MAHRAFASTILLALAVAGCAMPGADVAPAEAEGAAPMLAGWAEKALPFGDGHDHLDLASHQGLSTSNFELLGYDPLTTEALGTGAGGYLCADANGDATRRLAVVHSLSQTPIAFVVADVTNPAAPVKLGELVLEGTTARDVAVTKDTKFVVVATELPDVADHAAKLPVSPEAPTVKATWRSACGDAPDLELRIPFPESGPYPGGVLLVSLDDPAAPAITDFFPLPGLGAHSIGVDRVGEIDLVTAPVTNVAQHASYFMFFAIEGDKLAFQSVYQHRPVAANMAVENLHNDGWVREHPITGQWIAYLADWDAGLALVDVSDPKAPKDLGRWSDYDATKGLDNSAAVHSAVPLDTTWDGKHYTFIGQEILAHPRDTPTGVISVLDTTDPAAPVRVGAWTLPVDVEWDAQLVFSTHYIARVDRTLFVSMYHGGVWAVDVTEVTAPRSVGVYLPANEPPSPSAGTSYTWTPTVMEARETDTGEVVIWDSTSGLYVVRFDAARPAPAVDEWAFDWSP